MLVGSTPRGRSTAAVSAAAVDATRRFRERQGQHGRRVDRPLGLFDPVRIMRTTGMRRLLALTLLILTSVSSMEAVVGVMRDGEVHHENTLVAAAHAQVAGGDHGHEDATPSGEHRHGEGHDHGTAGDHCTHGHGPAILISTPPLRLTEGVDECYTESALPRAIVSDGFAHPPRA